MYAPRNIYAMDQHLTQTDWTGYWATGALHSCLGSYQGNYDGAVKSFWRRAWLDHLGSDDRVLDLGCGNGPLALLMMNESDEPALYCGVDLARVAPSWPARLPDSQRARLTFLGGCSMTDTGLPSDSIDWVVSQFGAEYVEPGPLLAELARVLSPSGCVALFLHHAGSRLAEVAREEAAHADWLFAEGGLMTATAQLLEPMSAARTPQGRMRLAKSPLAARLREAFNQAQDALSARAAGSIAPDLLFQARELSAQMLQLAQSQGLVQARAAWHETKRSIFQAQARHRSLCAAALDAQAAQALQAQIQALRGVWASELTEVCEGPYLVGWGLSFHHLARTSS